MNDKYEELARILLQSDDTTCVHDTSGRFDLAALLREYDSKRYAGAAYMKGVEDGKEQAHKEREAETCEWRAGPDGGWDTQCGYINHEYSDATDRTEGPRFCMCCGMQIRRIVEKQAVICDDEVARIIEKRKGA